MQWLADQGSPKHSLVVGTQSNINFRFSVSPPWPPKSPCSHSSHFSSEHPQDLRRRARRSDRSDETALQKYEEYSGQALAQLNVPAQVHLQAQFRQHGRLDPAGPVRLGAVGDVNNLDMIGLVPGHHLIAGDAV